MKKWLKIILFGILFIIFYIVIDIIFIFNFNRPLIIINKRESNVYKSIFYDVYNCLEYPTVQIKPKYIKFSCTIPKEITNN